ncbi:unnamed protein product [Thlaspi arvense]|uniref:Zinc knuckle CX2CX4HX4C domain-containing protein n=1 Tax=Thlaspi arvense TaxID=13288 RepID=A0AAU9SW79_THLAR|nr:unnamed protein product [Thlaspi arvense]
MEPSEHHLLTILENAPYTFKGWMVVIDRWNRRELPTFLKIIPFWIRIEHLPNIYRREQIVKSIGSKLGQVEEVEITEPTAIRPAEVWVKVRFNITLARAVQLRSNEPLVELEFRYDILQKFCTNCGSLKHSFDVCPHPPNPETQSLQDSSVDTIPPSSALTTGQPTALCPSEVTSSIPMLPSLPMLQPASPGQAETSSHMELMCNYYLGLARIIDFSFFTLIFIAKVDTSCSVMTIGGSINGKSAKCRVALSRWKSTNIQNSQKKIMEL